MEKFTDMEDEEIIAFFNDAMSAGIVEIPDCLCVVELDGICAHGNKSPLLEMDLI